MSKNIAKEIKAGKPLKQAIAIGYSVKKEASKSDKKSDKGKKEKKVEKNEYK